MTIKKAVSNSDVCSGACVSKQPFTYAALEQNKYSRKMMHASLT